MSECRYFPMCDMSDERCEASAQCAHYEPMPEVVRCRDCGWCEDQGGFHWCGYWENCVDEDGFCAWGERKDDAD